MNNNELLFNEEQLNRLFPFYILVNENLEIDSCGKSLAKLCPLLPSTIFTKKLFVKRPEIYLQDFQSIRSIANQLVILQIKDHQKLVLRGEFEYLESIKKLLFIGTPWFDSMEQVKANNLTIHDFANHDPLIDLLHLLKTQEITTDDLKELLLTVNKQKVALKSSAADFKRLSLVASANENGVLFTNPNGLISWANEGFYKLTGYSNEEVIGKSPVDLCKGPLTDETELSKVLEAFFNGQAFNTEIVYYKKDGSWFLGRSVSQPIKNENGNVTEFFGIIEDITAEIESEKKFRRVLEKIGDNVWEHDFKTGKTFFSKSYYDFLGYETNELIDNQELWWSSVHKDDLHLLIENDKKYCNGESDHHSLEYRIVQKNGNIKWVLDRGLIIEKDINGKPLLVTGTHTDITERKNVEERLNVQRRFYEDILNNMPADIAVFSPNHEYLFVNPRGIKDPDLRKWIIGKRDEDYCNFRNKPLSIAEGRRKTFNAVIGSKNVSEWEEKCILLDGREEYMLRRWFPVFNANEEIKLVIGYGIDITERKKLEFDLINSREQAEHLAKTKEVFLANMSHEIRTPMNAIMGMTNQLSKTELSNQQQFYLDTIKAASENLLIIINDILDLSKIDAGKLSLENIGFEPKKVVDHAMQVFLHRAEEKGIKLTNSFYDNKLSPILIGDPYRLNQVLLNLISNAIKFTDKGSVDITCEVIHEKKSTQLVQVKVIDSGIGMEESFVEKLFDKFSQEYESTSRRLGGTGLGMSICRELIQLMGGEIEASSEKGKGTTLTLRLKFKIGTTVDLPVNITSHITSNFLKGKIILVTDDNIMNRLVASTLLNDYGASVIEATNGEEALLVLENNKIDLLLLDIQMPVMNGYDTTKIIRKRGFNIPIIALTANAIKGENKKCIEVGMNDYISKPFKEDEFLKIIAKSLNSNFIEKEKALVVEDDKKIIESPLFDLSLLHEISRGDSSFIAKMIALFCEHTPEIVREMKEAYNAKDFEKMGALAHKIKPSIDNFKIDSIKIVIRNIEMAGKGKTNNDNLYSLLNEIDDVITKVEQQLQDYLQH